MNAGCQYVKYLTIFNTVLNIYTDNMWKCAVSGLFQAKPKANTTVYRLEDNSFLVYSSTVKQDNICKYKFLTVRSSTAGKKTNPKRLLC